MHTSARFDWRDLVPALPLLAIGLAGSERAAAQQADWVRPLDGWAYALIVVADLALLLRRRQSRLALVVCGLAIGAYLGAHYPNGPILLCGPAAAMVGGELTAGPAPEGGFAVRATLPLAVPSRVESP